MACRCRGLVNPPPFPRLLELFPLFQRVKRDYEPLPERRATLDGNSYANLPAPELRRAAVVIGLIAGALIGLWCASLWWLAGAALLHHRGTLPETLGAQWRRGLLWPLYLRQSRGIAPKPPAASGAPGAAGGSRRTSLLLVAAVTLLPLAAATQPINQTAVVEAAKAFLTAEAGASGGAVQIDVAPLDPRLRLAPCGQPLHAQFPPGAQMAHRTTVSVECPERSGWRIHLRATVSRQVEATAWRHDLPRGHLVTPADTVAVSLAQHHLPRNAVSAPEQAWGAVLRQPVRAQQPVRAHVLDRPPLVSKGEQISLTVADAPITISATVIALADGAAGDRIKVRSLSSDREIDVVVVGRGVVEAL